MTIFSIIVKKSPLAISQSPKCHFVTENLGKELCISVKNLKRGPTLNVPNVTNCSNYYHKQKAEEQSIDSRSQTGVSKL